MDVFIVSLMVTNALLSLCFSSLFSLSGTPRSGTECNDKVNFYLHYNEQAAELQ